MSESVATKGPRETRALRTTPRRAAIIAVVACAAVLGISAAFLNLVESRTSVVSRRHVMERTLVEVRAIEKQIDRALLEARAVSLRIGEGRRMPRFDQIAAAVLAEHPEIRSLALAPGGRVDAEFPPGSREAALARGLAESLDRCSGSPPSDDPPEITAHGPFPNDRGGATLIAALPVVLGAAPSDRRLWGCVVLTLDVGTLLGTSRLDLLGTEEYDYQITRTDPDSRRKVAIAGTGPWELEDPVFLGIRVADGTWDLAVAPRGGWGPRSYRVAGMFLVGALGLVAGLLTHGVARTPERLRREVEWRTHRLEETEKLLAQEKTEREAAVNRLEYQARHDSETDLPNQIGFLSRLSRELERTEGRSDCDVAVLLVHLDRLGRIREGLGGEAARRLLLTLVGRMTKSLRPEHALSRIGPGDLGILLYDVKSVVTAERFAEQLQGELKAPVQEGEMTLDTSVSVGIAVAPVGETPAEVLLRDADVALSRAQAKGGGVVVFESEMVASEATLLKLEWDLRRAIEENQFESYYQPIVSLKTGSIVAVESLVRWNHPQRGMVSPADFLPLAERTGLITAIDRWVLVDSCRQVTRWHETFAGQEPIALSVNLSGKELAQADLVDFVRRTLDDTRIDPKTVSLEITEGVMMENPDLAVAILSRLKEMSVKLSLDDFGTGYSSLTYLHRFPLDTVKLDRSFVWSMESEPKNVEIVKTVLAFAETLGMSVVAEGIETEEQARALWALGCQYGQGYLFSKPVAADGLEKLLRSSPRF